jgi:hypothetical protein
LSTVVGDENNTGSGRGVIYFEFEEEGQVTTTASNAGKTEATAAAAA